jgi:hypothetical protein
MPTGGVVSASVLLRCRYGGRKAFTSLFSPVEGVDADLHRHDGRGLTPTTEAA